MRLSSIIELLLILLIIAFSAYARVIDHDGLAEAKSERSLGQKRQNSPFNLTLPTLSQTTAGLASYCECKENQCDCCRQFHIPVIQGQDTCAIIRYVRDNELSMELKVGDNHITTQTISGKRPKPVCLKLPGGWSSFCGNIYSIARDGSKNFKACLALELRSSDQLEATLRVSCFRFGSDGLALRPAEPLPPVQAEPTDADDEEDFFGLDDDDEEEEDDDDDDDDDEPAEENAVATSAEDEDDDEEDDEDLLGLGALLDVFTGGDSANKKKPKVTTAAPAILAAAPAVTAPAVPLAPATVVKTPAASAPDAVNESDVKDAITTEETVEAEHESENETESTTLTSEKEVESENSDGVNNVSTTTKKPVRRIIMITKSPAIIKLKKPSLTAQSINAIPNTVTKPNKPIETPSTTVRATTASKSDEEDEDDDEDEDFLSATSLSDEEEDDDDDDESEDEAEESSADDTKQGANSQSGDKDEDESDAEEAEEDDDKDGSNKDEDEDETSLLSGEDDDDEDEDESILNVFEDDEESSQTSGKNKTVKAKNPKLKNDKELNNEAGNLKEDDAEYGLGLTELLAKKSSGRPRARGRQSKVMRL